MLTWSCLNDVWLWNDVVHIPAKPIHLDICLLETLRSVRPLHWNRNRFTNFPLAFFSVAQQWTIDFAHYVWPVAYSRGILSRGIFPFDFALWINMFFLYHLIFGSTTLDCRPGREFCLKSTVVPRFPKRHNDPMAKHAWRFIWACRLLAKQLPHPGLQIF